MKKSICALVFALAVAVAATPAARPPVRKAAAAFSAQDDARVESKIKEKLAKSKIGRNGFTVRVRAGVATWEGQTSVIQHKGAATRMAKTSGAKSVVNNIKIDEAARKKARERMQAGLRRTELKRASLRPATPARK